jgi:hypothetical protein
MSGWFDRRATRAGALTPDQLAKIKAINAAVASVDRAVGDHLFSIDTFERSAKKAGTGRVSPEWPRRIAGLEAETLRARDRLDKLHTGLRAQSVLRAALTELASAFGAWHRGLVATDERAVTQAIASMQRHYANAGRLGKSGLADLKAGR